MLAVRCSGAGGPPAAEDEAELSDSTKAVRRLQRELLEADAAPLAPKCRENDGRSRKREDYPAGDGIKTGLLTGIRLGEFGPIAKKARNGGGGAAAAAQDKRRRERSSGP